MSTIYGEGYVADSFFAPSAAHRTESPDAIVNDAQPVFCPETQVTPVGAVRHEPLTDETREEAIQLAGRLFLRYWARWEQTGDFGAKGDADRALRLQNLLIAGRSAEQVAKMESERGLS
jgi:hypothetical protein